MKFKTRFTAIFCTVSLLCAASAGAVLVTGTAEPPEEPAVQTSAPSPQLPAYTVAELEGSIGVYYMGELLYRTDISVYGLPETDRRQLQKGLNAETYNEVLSLLEDFSS